MPRKLRKKKKPKKTPLKETHTLEASRVDEFLTSKYEYDLTEFWKLFFNDFNLSSNVIDIKDFYLPFYPENFNSREFLRILEEEFSEYMDDGGCLEIENDLY